MRQWDISSALSFEPYFWHCGKTGLGSPGRGQTRALRPSGQDHSWVILVQRGGILLSVSTGEWSLGSSLPIGAQRAWSCWAGPSAPGESCLRGLVQIRGWGQGSGLFHPVTRSQALAWSNVTRAAPAFQGLESHHGIWKSWQMNEVQTVKKNLRFTRMFSLSLPSRWSCNYRSVTFR